MPDHENVQRREMILDKIGDITRFESLAPELKATDRPTP